MRKLFFFTMTLFLCFFVPVSNAYSAKTSTVSNIAGLSVSPALVTLTVSQLSPDAESIITLTNSYDVPLQIISELRSIDETSAQLLPTSPLAGDTAAALRISETTTVVPAKGTAKLKIAANNATGLSAGGHYASLVISEKATSTRSGSAFNSAIAVSVFVVKSDGVKRDLRLTNVTAGRTLFTLPSSVSLTFTNHGNTHVVPRASTGLYDREGELVAQAVINSESRLLLPGRSGNFHSQMRLVTHPLLPKHLTMLTTYRIDGTDVQLVQKQSFWYVPIIDVIAVTLLLIVVWRYRRTLARLPYKRAAFGLGRIVWVIVGLPWRGLYRICRWLKARLSRLETPEKATNTTTTKYNKSDSHRNVALLAMNVVEHDTKRKIDLGGNSQHPASPGQPISPISVVTGALSPLSTEKGASESILDKADKSAILRKSIKVKDATEKTETDTDIPRSTPEPEIVAQPVEMPTGKSTVKRKSSARAKKPVAKKAKTAKTLASKSVKNSRSSSRKKTYKA